MTDWPEPRNPTQLLQSLAYRVEKLEQEMTELRVTRRTEAPTFTPEEHYLEAERLLAADPTRMSEIGMTWTLARAQIHATLATYRSSR
jgi:hypothetical protein